MTRDIAPLRQAEDAVLVDSSGMTIEEVADTVIREFEKVNRDGSKLRNQQDFVRCQRRAVDKVYEEAGKNGLYVPDQSSITRRWSPIWNKEA